MTAVRNRWAMGTILVVAISAAYSNSFDGPFVFDDIDSIPNNPTIRHLWPLGPVLSPPSGGGLTVAGRPIINLSLAINHAISGTHVWSYHALNLLVHLLAALTLWGVARRTFELSAMPARLRESADGLALTVALLWGLHPLTTQAVTYIVQRAESIMALFYTLTFYCVIRGWTSPRPARWNVAAVVAAALGMASKETMATAPLMVLLYDRAFLAGSFRQALRSRWGLYAGLAATWGILVALAGGRAASAGFSGPVNAADYAITQFKFIALYLRLCIWPSPLILDYGISLVGGVREVLPQAVVVSSLLAATVAALIVRPRLGFLGAWVFVLLAPSSSLVPISTQTAAEHRMYLPLAGVVAIATLAAHWLLLALGSRLRLGDVARWRIGGVMVVLAAVLLGGRTFLRNRDYRSGVSIWADAIAKNPANPRAHYNLGRHYVDAGEYSLAAQEFRRTVQLKPDYPDGCMNLGCALARLGRYEEALPHFDRAIQVAPEKADNYYNRANSKYELGRYVEVIDDCDAALAKDARHAQAWYRRGLALQKLMRTEEAAASYSAAIHLRPDYRDAFGERAISYYFLKRYDEAWTDLRTFQRLGGAPNPEFVKRLSKASGPRQ